MHSVGQRMTTKHKDIRSKEIVKWLRIIQRTVEHIREQISSLMFPARCPVCDEILTPEQVKKGIHLECESKLYPVKGAVCMHCGRPLGQASQEYCNECYRKKYVDKSYIAQARSIYLYRGAIKQTMYRLKYSNKREYASFFAKKALESQASWLDKFTNSIDVIIPVPMYMPKQRKRGYNQAETFARELSKLTGIPVDTEAVERIKDTTPQKELNDKDRKNNLKNAFQKGKSIVQYSHAMIVDDIYTTGSTAEAVAKELKKTGVRQVYLLTICIGADM